MALIPHVKPGFYEEIIAELHPEGGDHPELGGVKEEHSRSMLPTGETILWVLAQNDVEKRLSLYHYFEIDHWFYKSQLIFLEPVKEGMPLMGGKLVLPAESVHLLLFGEGLRPRFGPDFPARQVETQMKWKDLILNGDTLKQIDGLRLWMKHEQKVRQEWNMAKFIPPGYRALFYGPSGTGKTLTASLLGKEFDMPVYRIDVSQVVSKYIGETEKNLEQLFVRAEHKNWILFFDEADSLFGKRSSANSANDRYANQSVSYLLQRIEYFDGIIILASNYKNNMDQAFIRRFNAIIKFSKPDEEERLRLWKTTIPKKLKVKSEILHKIAANYSITGAQIVNAVNYCCYQAAEGQKQKLDTDDLLGAIKIEYQKEEKVFNAID